MANFKSNIAYGYTGPGFQMPVTPVGAGVVSMRGVYTVPSTLAINDIVELCPLPPGCVPVDCIIESADIDSGTAIILAAGVINSGGTDLESGMNMITGSNIGQAGGMARAALATTFGIASTQTKRNVGLKVTTAATTAVAGQVAMTLFYRAAQVGE